MISLEGNLMITKKECQAIFRLWDEAASVRKLFLQRQEKEEQYKLALKKFQALVELEKNK